MDMFYVELFCWCRDFVSDFDLMMEKKKAEMGRRRKRRDVDIINDNDDIVMAMITQMKEAAEVCCKLKLLCTSRNGNLSVFINFIFSLLFKTSESDLCLS